MIDQALINHWTTYHPPASDQVALYETIRNHGREFMNVVNALVPDGEQKSEAMSFIRYAIMASNAGIALSAPVTPISDHRRATAVKTTPLPNIPPAATYQTASTGAKTGTASNPATNRGPSMQDLIDGFVSGRK